jgi:MBOAT membrane-bound O-acyltransferase family protein
MAALGDYLLAAALFPALGMNASWRRSVLLMGSLMILTSPALIPRCQPGARFVVALVAVSLVTKLHDLCRGADLGQRPSLRAYLAFLPNLALLVLRKASSENRARRSDSLRKSIEGGAGLVVGAAALGGIFRVEWQHYPFWAEHAAKTTALYLVVISGAKAGAALWRLLGGIAREPMDNPHLAPTPAEFWRRWNRPAQQFLSEDVFKPAGGWRSPIRATLLTFLVSAAVHEYVFGIATARIQGVQALFFLLQGGAAAATLRIRPEGRRAIPWIAATLLFNLITSVLFFVSVNRICRWYSPR